MEYRMEGQGQWILNYSPQRNRTSSHMFAAATSSSTDPYQRPCPFHKALYAIRYGYKAENYRNSDSSWTLALARGAGRPFPLIHVEQIKFKQSDTKQGDDSICKSLTQTSEAQTASPSTVQEARHSSVAYASPAVVAVAASGAMSTQAEPSTLPFPGNLDDWTRRPIVFAPRP